MLNDSNLIGFYSENEKYGCFSNWYPSSFEYAGVKYSNMEQYMMYQKMRTFSQYDIADKIMGTTDPGECKRLGRSHIDNWNGELWEKISYAVVKRGIKAKFFQNKDLLGILLDTEDVLLAECAPNDKKWGIGVASDDDRRYDVREWTGHNLLGRILMDVREEMRLLDQVSRGRLFECDYYDARDMDSIPEWNMTIGELIRNPKYRNTVNAYREVCNWFVGRDLTHQIALSAAENMHRTNMGGGLPPQGFWELKQDLYEIRNDMFVNSSGFDAPAYGEPLPAEAKLVKQDNGRLKIVMPGDEGYDEA